MAVDRQTTWSGAHMPEMPAGMDVAQVRSYAPGRRSRQRQCERRHCRDCGRWNRPAAKQIRDGRRTGRRNVAGSRGIAPVGAAKTAQEEQLGTAVVALLVSLDIAADAAAADTMVALSGKQAVNAATIEYAAEVRHDGRLYAFAMPNLEIPVCRAGGEKVFTEDIEPTGEQRAAVAPEVLTPAKIRNALERLDMSPRNWRGGWILPKRRSPAG